MAFYDDIPNVANCSDVAQLYECALLMINNSKLLRDWVNGSVTTDVVLGGQSQPSLRKLIQNINRVAGIATSISPGAVRPDNVTTQVDTLGVLSVIIGGLIENGGGIVTGSGGKLTVDFSQMPTDKFEKLLKALRLPIWLTANMNFYVNNSHSAASDTLDEGRGLSPNKPFKSIKACVNYVTENYNFGKYNININISNGTYDPFSVNSYTSSGGVLNIIGDSANKPVILGENATCCAVGSCILNLLHLKFSAKIQRTSQSGITAHRCLQASNQANVSCGGVDFLLDHVVSSEGASTNNDIVIQSDSFSIVKLGYSIASATDYQNSLEFHRNGYGNIVVLYATNNGVIYLSGSRVSSQNAACPTFGECSTFADADNSGMIALYGTYANQFNFQTPSGKATTGKRYIAESGGKINVKNLGAEYFPGNSAGTVETSTYSWYK